MTQLVKRLYCYVPKRWSQNAEHEFLNTWFPALQSLLPRGERPNPLREKNATVNGLVRSWLPRLGQQAQFLDVGRDLVHSDGTIIPQDMFDFLHLTSTGYGSIAKPLSDLLLQILEETPEERRASLVWGAETGWCAPPSNRRGRGLSHGGMWGGEEAPHVSRSIRGFGVVEWRVERPSRSQTLG